MTALSTFPAPTEIAHQLERSPSPAEPFTDLATLEKYYQHWPYPKSLDCWEGYIFADLCEQVGWAYYNHEEYSSALQAWRACPWSSTVEGERQALALLLQSAYEEQTLVVGPPVSDLLQHGRIALGAVLATLDDPTASLNHAASGIGYVVESRLVQPDGVYALRFEFDETTLFYVSFLPTEVYSKLLTARAAYLMEELKDAAGWLLRAAFMAQSRGLAPEAFSFLEKAAQCDGENQAVQKSLTNLRIKGVGPTLFSRVVVERVLFQPDPVRRCEVRPRELPGSEPLWLSTDWPKSLPAAPVSQDTKGRVVSLGILPIERAKDYASQLTRQGSAWPLLFSSAWEAPNEIDDPTVEKRVSKVRGLSLEKLGLWKGDYRPVLNEMLSSWPAESGQPAAAEVIDFALPKEVRLAVFGCSELWQIPTMLDIELPELESVEVLAAWWRRLLKRWQARPFLVADDVIWFQMDELPREGREEMFLADLLTFSSDVAECFEPSMIRPTGPGQPYLFPVPLQLTFHS